MNKTLQISALALIAVSASAFAHHPAADIVDPEVYEMIEENISEVHLDMTFDDMGGNSADIDSEMGSGNDEAGSMVADLEDVGAAIESREAMGSMTDVESGGQMNGQI